LLDLVTGGWRPLFRLMIHLLREECVQELVLGPIDQIQDILHQCILVLVGHPRDVVQHITGVVLDQELIAAGLEVGIRGKHIAPLDEGVVGSGRVGVGGRGSVVQGSEDTGGTLLLDQSAYDSVVEDCGVLGLVINTSEVWLTLDRSPLDLLADVFLLLRLQRKLDKDLLELLIDVIDTELLEAVILEDLKPATKRQHTSHRRLAAY